MKEDPLFISRNVHIIAQSLYTRQYGDIYYLKDTGHVTTDHMQAASAKKTAYILEKTLESLHKNPTAVHKQATDLLLHNIKRIVEYEEQRPKKKSIIERGIYFLLRIEMKIFSYARPLKNVLKRHRKIAEQCVDVVPSLSASSSQCKSKICHFVRQKIFLKPNG